MIVTKKGRLWDEEDIRNIMAAMTDYHIMGSDMMFMNHIRFHNPTASVKSIFELIDIIKDFEECVFPLKPIL